jgi:hypothetical protein
VASNGKRKPIKIKLLIKSLSIPAIGGIFAGTAFAGLADAYLRSHAVSVAKANAEKKWNTSRSLCFDPE